MSHTDDHETPSAQPSSGNKTEEKERQQIIEEDKLLAEAGVNVAEINNPEERRQMLAVLRISLPAPASSAEPASTSEALEETQPFGEGIYPANTLVEDEDIEMEVTPALTSIKPAQSSSAEKPSSSSNAEPLAQQPQATGRHGKLRRRRVQKTAVEGNEEMEVDVTDSCHTSDVTSSPPAKPSRTRTTKSGEPDSSSDIGNLGKAPQSLTVRSSLKQIDYSSDSDQCTSSKFAPKCNVKGGKDGSSDSDMCIKPLQTRLIKKLTGDQIQKAKDTICSMLTKSKSFSQPDTLSPVEEEKEETTEASQDLFKAGDEEVEPVETSPTFPSQPTPGNHPAPSQDMVSKDEDPCGLDVDVETIPLDSPAQSLTLLCAKEQVDNDDDEDDNSLSQEFPVQTTQPVSVAVERADRTLEAVPTPSHEREEEARGEEGDSEKEADDKQPLRHDNWFCWSHSQTSQPLQRRYRKRKRLQEETKPYFCPSAKVDPASYTKVIVQLFDIYFAQFTKMQSLLKNKLPWGKPVHAGLHHVGTLDVKRKGEFSLVAVDAEDDDSDDFSSAPAVKKRAVGEGVQTRTGLRTVGGRELRHINPLVHAATGAVNSMHKGSKEMPLPGTSSAIEEATEPYDLDDELPDLSLDISASQRAKSLEVKHTTLVIRMETDEDRNTTKRSVSPFSSQSSNSRLDENGDLYCTQLPNRSKGHQPSQFVLDEEDVIVKESSSQPKRRVTERSQNRRDGGDGTMRKTRRQAETGQPKTETLQSILARKRKQVESAAINLDDVSDDEISFPQKRKREMPKTVVDPKTQEHQVKMSIIVDTDKSRAVVHGVNVKQVNIQHEMSGSARNNQGALEGSQSRYFQDTKRPGPRACSGPVETNPLPVESGITDDDDSAQFVSLMQSGQGSQDQRLEQQQASKQKVQEKIAMEEQTECPLCGKSFPVSKIEQHASSCGEEQEEDPLPQVATTTPLFPRGQMSRRPLHTNTRDDFVCPYCDAMFGGKGAKERHMEKCIQQMTQHQHEILMGRDVVAGTRGRATRTSAETAGPFMSKQQGLFGAYKIPKIGDPSRRQATATKQVLADTYDIENVPSDDSDGDPTFTLTKDDLRQAKEDVREDGDNDSPVAFKPVSKQTDSSIDFKNQFPGKGRTRQPKMKDL